MLVTIGAQRVNLKILFNEVSISLLEFEVLFFFINSKVFKAHVKT